MTCEAFPEGIPYAFDSDTLGEEEYCARNIKYEICLLLVVRCILLKFNKQRTNTTFGNQS